MLLQTPRCSLEAIAVVETAGDRMDDLVGDGIPDGVRPAFLEVVDGKIHLKSFSESVGPAAGFGEPGVKSDGPDQPGLVSLLG